MQFQAAISRAITCTLALTWLSLVSMAAAQQQSTPATATKPAPPHKHPNDKMLEAHGVLMAVSFVAIIPISVIISSSRHRFLGSSWLQIHRALGLVAALFIIVGAILGIIGWTEIPRVRRILLAHMVIGLILLAFVVLQVSIALGRPNSKSNIRRWWAPTHHNVGRLALLLGFANAIIGAYAGHMGYDWYVWICVVWGVIMLVGIPLIIYARMNPRGEAAASEKAPSGAATTTRPHRDAANDTPYV